MDDFTVSIITDEFRVIEVQLPGATMRRGGLPEYPSQWFRKNPKAKPYVFLPKKIDPGDTWDGMLGYALTGSINPNVAIRFLYEFITNNYVETLASDWVSYGVTIGEEGSQVTPFSLLNVKEKDDAWTAPEGKLIKEYNKFTLFAMLIAGYRYGIASEVTCGEYYKRSVLKNINQVLTKEPYNLPSELTSLNLKNCKTWYLNQEFRVIIAALDMFWTKFPDSTGERLRVCTLNSRFKDCSTICELRHLSEIVSQPVGNILKYIFWDRVRDEVLAITKSDEEIEKEDSYFPYMKELRLSKKSPYSTTQNVHLHHWVSMFGALLGSERSFNAKIFAEAGLNNSMNLALFAAYAFRKHIVPKMAQATRTTEELDAVNRPGQKIKLNPSTPQEVYQHIRDNKNVVPSELITMFAQVIERMGTPRDKTIGMFLKRNLV